jgi:hypothetical protein
LALNVSEPWLMGFDVPMERTSIQQPEKSHFLKTLLTSEHKSTDITKLFMMKKISDTIDFETIDYELLTEFKKLNAAGKKEAIDRIKEMNSISKYTD